jgi:hypothetical protein
MFSIFAVVIIAGCATTDSNIAMTKAPVSSIVVGEATEVSAYDLAQAMLRAGFTRDQILANGPSVRLALATSGGAQVRDGKVIGALFSVHENQLYVTSRSRGTFVQPLGANVANGAM